MNTYTMKDWMADGSLRLQRGQNIDEEVFAQLRDGVPPTTLANGVFQVGEAYNHDYTGRALYSTFKNTADGWEFCGYCREGETVHRIGLGEVEAHRVIAVEFEGVDDHNRAIFAHQVKKGLIWRFGCLDFLFSWDATENEVIQVLSHQSGEELRRKFFYFGNKFGCEPSGEELYNGDKVVIYHADGQILF